LFAFCVIVHHRGDHVYSIMRLSVISFECDGIMLARTKCIAFKLNNRCLFIEYISVIDYFKSLLSNIGRVLGLLVFPEQLSSISTIQNVAVA
jgi:hypothetical protein